MSSGLPIWMHKPQHEGGTWYPTSRCVECRQFIATGSRVVWRNDLDAPLVGWMPVCGERCEKVVRERQPEAEFLTMPLPVFELLLMTATMTTEAVRHLLEDVALGEHLLSMDVQP